MSCCSLNSLKSHRLSGPARSQHAAVPVAEEDSGVTIPKIFQKDVAVETADQWKHCLTMVEIIYLVHSGLS